MCKIYPTFFYIYIYGAITMYNFRISKVTLKYRPDEDDLEEPCRDY